MRQDWFYILIITVNPQQYLKRINVLAVVAMVLAAILTSCNDADADLRRMIPADATAVAVVNVPEILHNLNIEGGSLKLPASLHDIVTENDDSPLCQVLAKLPRLGINIESHIYAFMPAKGPLASVMLVALSNADDATTTIQRMTGTDFKSVDNDVKILTTGQLMCAIKDKTLLVARTVRGGNNEALGKEAIDILTGQREPLANDNSPLSTAADNTVSLAAVSITPAALNKLLAGSDAYSRAVAVAPVIQLFTESDIDNISLSCVARNDSIAVDVAITARDDSDYSRLMTKVMAGTDADVLKVIPVTMDMIAMMSVHGNNITDLQQVQQMLNMFKQQQYIGKMDLKPILSTINGPIACGVAADPHLFGVWNAVIAARSSSPQQVLQYIADFGSAYGQMPQQENGELIYGWDNKMVSIGAQGNIVYVKMLDYIQTEGPASDITPLRDAFSTAVTGLYSRVKSDNDISGTLIFTMTDAMNGHATYTADTPVGSNPTLEFLRMLASIKPDAQYTSF